MTYRDVTALFGDARGFRLAVDRMLRPYAGREIDKVAGLEGYGFILGGAIAHRLGCGFIPVGRAGRAPGTAVAGPHCPEYAEAGVEIHEDAVEAGETVLLVDDFLARGGSVEAGIRSLERLGADICGCSFIGDFPELHGRHRINELGFEAHVLCELREE